VSVQCDDYMYAFASASLKLDGCHSSEHEMKCRVVMGTSPELFLKKSERCCHPLNRGFVRSVPVEWCCVGGHASSCRRRRRWHAH
jgi:hypothetical protein